MQSQVCASTEGKLLGTGKGRVFSSLNETFLAKQSSILNIFCYEVERELKSFESVATEKLINYFQFKVQNPSRENRNYVFRSSEALGANRFCGFLVELIAQVLEGNFSESFEIRSPSRKPQNNFQITLPTINESLIIHQTQKFNKFLPRLWLFSQKNVFRFASFCWARQIRASSLLKSRCFKFNQTFETRLASDPACVSSQLFRPNVREITFTARQKKRNSARLFEEAFS